MMTSEANYLLFRLGDVVNALYMHVTQDDDILLLL